MAPKRSAPQPPPPPAASSEDTASGSGSEEEEEEEEIAQSPPLTAPKTLAPPPQKGQESEEEDEEEEDEEEEEQEEAENHVAPPPATKNPSPTPRNREESESSGDEEDEETDDEAPQPKPATNHEAEGKGAKPSSSEDKKPGAPFQRTWSTDDEVRILEALAAHRRVHGTLPQLEALAATLAGSLDNSGCSLATLQYKLKALKRRYRAASEKGELPSKDHDRRLFDLSKSVWGSDDGAWREEFEVRILEALAVHRRVHGTLPQLEALAATLAGSLDNSGCSLAMLQGKLKALKRRYRAASEKGELPSKDHDRRLFDLSKSVWGLDDGAQREFGEMCELYPYLAEEVKVLQKAHLGVFKRKFEMIGEEKARMLEEKIKRQRLHQAKLYQRRHDVNQEVTRTLIDLMER